jgi:hypothetical protein
MVLLFPFWRFEYIRAVSKKQGGQGWKGGRTVVFQVVARHKTWPNRRHVSWPDKKGLRIQPRFQNLLSVRPLFLRQSYLSHTGLYIRPSFLSYNIFKHLARVSQMIYYAQLRVVYISHDLFRDSRETGFVLINGASSVPYLSDAKLIRALNFFRALFARPCPDVPSLFGLTGCMSSSNSKPVSEISLLLHVLSAKAEHYH